MFKKSAETHRREALKKLYDGTSSWDDKGTVDCKNYRGVYGHSICYRGLQPCAHSDECSWEGQGYLVNQAPIGGREYYYSCSGIKKKTLKKKIKELNKLKGE